MTESADVAIFNGSDDDAEVWKDIEADVICYCPKAGYRLPVDARIFEAFNLDMDESMLTGESTLVVKTV